MQQTNADKSACDQDLQPNLPALFVMTKLLTTTLEAISNKSKNLQLILKQTTNVTGAGH